MTWFEIASWTLVIGLLAHGLWAEIMITELRAQIKRDKIESDYRISERDEIIQTLLNGEDDD